MARSSAADVGGTIYNTDGTSDLRNCMMTGNSADQGGALFDYGGSATLEHNDRPQCRLLRRGNFRCRRHGRVRPLYDNTQLRFVYRGRCRQGRQRFPPPTTSCFLIAMHFAPWTTFTTIGTCHTRDTQRQRAKKGNVDTVHRSRLKEDLRCANHALEAAVGRGE